MGRTLVSKLPFYAAQILSASSKPKPLSPSPHFTTTRRVPSTFCKQLRWFSSENGSSSQDPPPETTSIDSKKAEIANVEDISTKELSRRINKYFKGDEAELPSIMEAILQRRLSRKHDDSDDELMEELRFQPIDGVNDKEFESDFEEAHETDNEIDNLYNARQYVQKKMAQDEYFNMDPEKWDEMIKEAQQKGYLQDSRECEEILEDMLSWDKILPDEIKQKVEAKFNELGDMCERGELEPADAYALFKEFEDKMVQECAEMMAKEQPPMDDNITPTKEKKLQIDDPPGEGPILRWETRVVFAPGGDAWHPKNRKVKLAVTVKELGLSRHAFRRLREVVGKRYHPGKDELTITSERFEHREENRKDCLRTLYALIDDAEKANELVDEARTSYVKGRLRANPEFMERLRARTTTLRESLPAAPL